MQLFFYYSKTLINIHKTSRSKHNFQSRLWDASHHGPNAFLHSWYHVRRRWEADAVLIAHAWCSNLAAGIKISRVIRVCEWLFHSEGTNRRGIWIFHPTYPQQWHIASLDAHRFTLLFHSSVFLHIHTFMIPSFPHYLKTKAPEVNVLPLYTIRSPKTSLFGLVNVWEGALCCRLWPRLRWLI